MFDTIQNLQYRANAGILQAQEELNKRLNDRMELPLPGIYGEKLYLTGVGALREQASQLDAMYKKLPAIGGTKDTLLLDSWSSAAIDGTRTTMETVRNNLDNPQNKDDRIVANILSGAIYAYGRPITEKNIRRLWIKIIDGICENTGHMGSKYRDDTVYFFSAYRFSFNQAQPDQLSKMMQYWFTYQNETHEDFLIRSFVAHFYFIYLQPFCDCNGRTARILNASQLYYNGYKKMKGLPLAYAIYNHMDRYYSTLAESETVINDGETKWLDLTPFVSYMLEVFEQCLIDAALSRNSLTESERTLLERLNEINNQEITVRKATEITKRSGNATRCALENLVRKGYLDIDTSRSRFIYKLKQFNTE